MFVALNAAVAGGICCNPLARRVEMFHGEYGDDNIR
jgi:hypothetical protein